MSRVAVVILNLNGLTFLKTLLPGVIAASAPHKVVVVDNGSSDGSLDYLTTAFPDLHTIALPGNYGYCGGYNAGLRAIEAEYYVLLNSDVEVQDGWIEPVLAVFERDPMVAVVQPKMLAYDDRSRFEYAGAAGGFIDAWGYPFCRGRIFDTMEEDTAQYDTTAEIFWASGACMFIRSALFHRFGGLDEDFFAHMEEIDLCWRLKNAGYRIMYTPESTIFHVGGGTLPKHNPQKTFLNFRNALYLLLKNLPLRTLIWKFPIRMMIDYVAAFKFLLTGKHRDALAVLRAHRCVVRNGVQQLRKRPAVLQSPDALGGYYKGMILYQYHLLRHRKFSDLDHPVNTI
jgi:GT2 family glycosyltransferase